MLHRLKRMASKGIQQNTGPSSPSFSQSGEDLIMDFALKNNLGIKDPTYLDIGAYDPIKYSNTYLFYQRGSRGILIEPDPDLAQKLGKVRPNDKVLNVGVSLNNSSTNFYLVDPPTLNTFSKKEFERYKLFYPEMSLRKIIKQRTLSINTILKDNFSAGIDILSIDIEGLDLQVLTSINFDKYRPAIICIESVEYAKNNTLVKVKEIRKLLTKKSYFLYADSFINSIFVDNNRWVEANQPILKNFNGR